MAVYNYLLEVKNDERFDTVFNNHRKCVHNNQKCAVNRDVHFINAFLFLPHDRIMSLFKHTGLFCLSLNIADTLILVSSKVQINKAHAPDSYTGYLNRERPFISKKIKNTNSIHIMQELDPKLTSHPVNNLFWCPPCYRIHCFKTSVQPVRAILKRD